MGGYEVNLMICAGIENQFKNRKGYMRTRPPGLEGCTPVSCILLFF